MFGFLSSKRTLHVASRDGFHLRPAARFSTEAKRFACDVSLCKGETCVDAKRLDALLSLGLRYGDHVILRTRGKGAKTALAELAALFETLMQTNTANTPSPQSASPSGHTIVEGTAVGIPFRLHTPSSSHGSATCSFQEAVQRLFEQLTSGDSIAQAQHALLESLPPCNDIDDFRNVVQDRIAALRGGAMEAKADDYRDLLARLEAIMYDTPPLSWPKVPFIVFSEGMLPSTVHLLPPHTRGVVLASTSPASHTAVLLRSKNIVSLIVPALPETLPQHPVILDATEGRIDLSADHTALQNAQKTVTTQQMRRNDAYARRFEPAVTREGIPVRILANVGSIEEAQAAKEAGAEGIGLLRTEFLFRSDTPPSYETQRDIYAQIFETFDDVTVRTLDIGGDKPAAYVHLPQEANPFLGLRGIRLLSRFPDLFETQLRALFDAASGKPLKVMFPMIATPEEFDRAKTFAMQTAQKHRCDITHVRFGMMLEVPSVLFAMEAFNRRVDFYSIGSNDLAQYLFAVERTHPELYVDETSPALLRAVQTALQQSDKPMSLCGELAAHPKTTAALIDAGLRTFSVSPAAIAELKERIRRV